MQADKTNEKNNWLNTLMNYLLSPSIIKEINIEKDDNDNIFNLIEIIKEKISDPLSIILFAIVLSLVYLYMICDIICTSLGLFGPLYYLYTLITPFSPENVQKFENISKYFIIFGHIELISFIFSVLGIHLYHIKFLILLMILYSMGYQSSLFNKFYDTAILYDKIFYRLILTGYIKIKKELKKTKNDIANDIIRNDDKKEM